MLLLLRSSIVARTTVDRIFPCYNLVKLCIVRIELTIIVEKPEMVLHNERVAKQALKKEKIYSLLLIPLHVD